MKKVNDMKCKYGGCEGTVFKKSDFCILHTPLPEKEDSDDFRKIDRLKSDEVGIKIKRGDFNFKGVKLVDADFSGEKIEDDLIFTHASIRGSAEFNKTRINGDLWFDRAEIGGHVSFEGARIHGSASFYNARIEGHAWFDGADIGEYLWFERCEIGREASFNNSRMGGSISFRDARVSENLSFYNAKIDGYAWFDDATIGGDTWFDFIAIKGGLSFNGTHFRNLKGQEKAYRMAKSVWEKLGDREKADYHFYHEMGAKRLQKPFYIRYPELIVQYPFGYGVYPARLLFTFAMTLIIFAFIYWIIDGTNTLDSLINKIRFSFLTIIIPAYGLINAKTGIYGIFTILEAVIGAFTWPTFLVTFARKYMR